VRPLAVRHQHRHHLADRLPGLGPSPRRLRRRDRDHDRCLAGQRRRPPHHGDHLMSTEETPTAPDPAPESPAPTAGGMSRGRTWSVRVPVILGSLVLVLAVLALWLSREALDTNTYTTTSSQVLEQPAVQQALARTMVDQLYANVDVAAQLQQVLPKQAQGLAPV